MLKLFTKPGACSSACHIALQESGVPFETKIMEDKSFETPAFLQANQKGYVPFLEIDASKSLTEGAAIMQYIADLVPEKNLIPAKGFERYKAQEWLNFISTEIHKGFTPLFMAETLVQDPAARVQFVNTVTEVLNTKFEYVNKALEGKNFILGNNYSVIDGYLFTVLSWAKHLNISLSKWNNIVSFQNRVYERPATQRALKAEGILN